MSTVSALVLTLALSAPSDTVLLEFSAAWCGPCRTVEPTVRRLISAGYPVRQIDVDRESAIASRFRVTGVPCFVMLVDGKEVDRVSGPVSYARLTQMYTHARVRPQPAQAAAPGSSMVGANRRDPRGNIVRAQSPDGPPSPSTLAALPRTSAPPAGSSAPTGVDPAAVQAAFQATVRLKVEDAQGHGSGTGTIIDAHEGEALVVTCGHLFRESAGKGTIHVDVFQDGTPRTVPGNLISYDLDRDIALVSITPGRPVSPVRVATDGKGISRGAAVFSIGCDQGAAPSVRKSHVTAIDRYLGPPNIEVAGQPVEGRSGGGLFSSDGRLIGICNAADPADDEGIYAGLATIHWELDRIGQRRIYAANDRPAPARSDLAAVASPERLPQPASPPAMPDRMVVPVAASQMQPVQPTASDPSSTGIADADTEVICIIRSRRDPQGQQKLLVLDRPSAELLNRIRRESQSSPAAASIARQPTAPPRRGNEPVIRAQSADR